MPNVQTPVHRLKPVAKRTVAATRLTRHGRLSYNTAMNFDAVVVGSGPNGLAAAIELRRAGCSVAVYEGRPTVGGGARSAELTLPGFLHDVCSAIHPLALSSPFFKTLPLQELGIEWIQPDFPLAHTLDDGDAVILDRNLSVTAEQLGPDSRRYVQIFERFVRQRETLMAEILAPPHIPRHPLLLAAFARHGLRSAQSFAYSNFAGERARALFAGIAGHSALALDSRPGAAFGLVLSILGHSVGWPIPKGGSQQIANGLAAYFTGLGGRIFTDTPIASLSDLPSSKVVLCDVTPRQLIQMAPERMRSAFSGKWRRYRHGPGACKVDWALHSPIPWKSLHCKRAGTIHIGGSFQEIAAAEQAPARGQPAERPFIILAQPSLFDGTRAPAGRHTAWAYCHVPNGSHVRHDRTY